MGSRYRRGNPYRNPNKVPKASCIICGRGITYRHYEREDMDRMRMEYICNRGCWDEFRLSHPLPMRINDDGDWEVWVPKLTWISYPGTYYADNAAYEQLGELRSRSYGGHWAPIDWYLTEGF